MGRGTADGRFSGAARRPGMGGLRCPAPENRRPSPQGHTQVVTAWRTRPAGDHSVGGDWCAVIDLPDGRTGLAVGDAMGHGPDAAAEMTRLRTATHVLARAGLRPHALLAGLSHLADTSESTFATCAYAVIEPVSESATIALAGHPPPVLALPEGATSVIELPPGLPLGVGRARFPAATVTLPPGSTLALYTDGLVECHTRPMSAVQHGDRGTAPVAELRGRRRAAAASGAAQLPTFEVSQEQKAALVRKND
jgi:serine phosphatase RsbU (regulator of sigma subunit)